MGFVFILGRAGTVNIKSSRLFRPPAIDQLHVRPPRGAPGGDAAPFSLMTLSIVDAWGRYRPPGRGGESVGSRGIRQVLGHHLPADHPGYVSGALLVFIWTFADFATPLVVGISDLLASQAYLNIVQFVDRRLFKMGIVISAIMVILAILFLIIAKKYVSIKDYSSLSYSVIERKKLLPAGAGGGDSLSDLILILAFIPYLGLALDSFGKGWALTPFPVK